MQEFKIRVWVIRGVVGGLVLDKPAGELKLRVWVIRGVVGWGGTGGTCRIVHVNVCVLGMKEPAVE